MEKEANEIVKSILDFTKLKKAKEDKKSAYSLLAANLIPLFGIIFFGWSAFMVIFLYWAENLVIGFYNVFRILLAEKANIIGRIFFAGFFTIHYGMFTLVHGIFVFVLFGFMAGMQLSSLFSIGIAAGLIALFVSHGISFIWNYLVKKEYKKEEIRMLMFRPYKRIIVMHISIIAGGFLTIFFMLPAIAIIPFIILKIYFDLNSHLILHENEQK